MSNAAGELETKYSVSPGFVSRLKTLGLSLVVTSYQSGLLYFLGANRNGGLNVHQTALKRPMGVRSTGVDEAGRCAGFVVADYHRLIHFTNGLRSGEIANEMFDGCFAPRTLHLTGRLDAHDVGVDRDRQAFFVNTRFNSLSRPDQVLSFRNHWMPPFVSDLIDEDRCHLNGLAMQDGVPRFVTAISRSDTIDGWRDRRADGGVVVDVASNEIVASGLSMPHSPRIDGDRLWLLNSGTGEIGEVVEGRDPETAFEPLAFCPGFTRGLALSAGFAFVGLSKPRYERFTGLALDERLREADSDPWCGVQVIELSSGACVDWFRIDGEVGEIYDVEILAGLACPMAVSPNAPEAQSFLSFG